MNYKRYFYKITILVHTIVFNALNWCFTCTFLGIFGSKCLARMLLIINQDNSHHLLINSHHFHFPESV